MKEKNELSYIIISIFILLLFCISNCIKIFNITQPKIFGIFILITLSLLIILKKIKIKRLKELSFIKGLSIGLLILSVISFLSIIINKKFEMTNIYEFIRPIIYILCIIIFTYIFNNKKKIDFFNKFLYFLIILFFIFDIIQFHNLYNINNLYIKVIAPTQYITLVNGYGYPRVVGLMSNPNVYGYILSLFSLYLLYLLINSYYKKKKVDKVLIFLLIINRINMFLTGSRTAYICSIVSELMFLFIYILLNKKKIILKNLLISSGICLFVLLSELSLMFALPNKYSWRIKSIFSNKISSWEKRKETNNNILNDIIIDNYTIDKSIVNNENLINEVIDNESHETLDNDIPKELSEDKKINYSKFVYILFGSGPIKDGFSFDNEWTHIFVTFGILGILAFLSIYILGIINIKKCSISFKIFYISLVSLNFIYMIAAGSYFSYNLFIAFILFLIIVYMEEVNEK